MEYGHVSNKELNVKEEPFAFVIRSLESPQKSIPQFRKEKRKVNFLMPSNRDYKAAS